MLLEEANSRLKTMQLTEDQLFQLGPLYYILNLDKDDFCKIVDLIGFDKLVQQRKRYERFEKAEHELQANERYLQAKQRLQEIGQEKQELEKFVSDYKPFRRSNY